MGEPYIEKKTRGIPTLGRKIPPPHGLFPSPAQDAPPDPLDGWEVENTCWGGGYPLPRSLPSQR